MEPLFYGAHALNSYRSSGLSLSSAISELIDNSIQANSTAIQIAIQFADSGVQSIICADDGNGMSVEVLSRYLTIGRSNSYYSTEFISKFGIGAKASGLTFGRVIEAYSRTSNDSGYYAVNLNLTELMDAEENGRHNEVGIHSPIAADLPSESIYLSNQHEVNTLIKWTSIDKIKSGEHFTSQEVFLNNLRLELSRMFRHYIQRGVSIFINSERLVAFDPLYRIERSYQNSVLSKCYQRQSTFPSISIANEFPFYVRDGHAAKISVVLYPREVTRRPGLGADTLAKSLKIPNNLGRISFLRSNREISYSSISQIFGRAVQSEDRFIGISCSFPPALDDLFNVRHIKRGCEPVESVRSALQQHLTVFVRNARNLLKQSWLSFGKQLPSEPIEFSFLNDSRHDSSLSQTLVLPKSSEDKRYSSTNNVPSVKLICFKENAGGDSIVLDNLSNSNTVERLTVDVNSELYKSIYAPLLALKSRCNDIADKKLLDSVLSNINKQILNVSTLIEKNSTVGQ